MTRWGRSSNTGVGVPAPGLSKPLFDEAIKSYAQTLDDSTLSAVDCKCKEIWREELVREGRSAIPLEKRIVGFIDDYNNLVRHAAMSDMDEVLRVEEQAWPEGTRATR